VYVSRGTLTSSFVTDTNWSLQSADVLLTPVTSSHWRSIITLGHLLLCWIVDAATSVWSCSYFCVWSLVGFARLNSNVEVCTWVYFYFWFMMILSPLCHNACIACLFVRCIGVLQCDGLPVWWYSVPLFRTSGLAAGELSLSCARVLAGYVTTLWLSHPLSDSQHGQLSHSSVRVGKWVVIHVIRYMDYGEKALAWLIGA